MIFYLDKQLVVICIDRDDGRYRTFVEWLKKVTTVKAVKTVKPVQTVETDNFKAIIVSIET
jgi:hypothetical protein